MTTERAEEISAAMFRTWFGGTYGIVQEPPKAGAIDLSTVCLSDMVQAQGIIAARNKIKTVKPDGTVVQSISQVFDDRLTAALYTWLHYEGEDTPCRPIVSGSGKALIVVKLSPEVMVDGEDG